MVEINGSVDGADARPVETLPLDAVLAGQKPQRRPVVTRLAGIETEYGCLTLDPNGSLETVRRVRDWLFAGSRYGLIDRQQRDWDEPAGNGGFLFNGGRLPTWTWGTWRSARRSA